MQGFVFWSIYINLNQQSNKIIKLKDGTHHETEQTMILIADLEQACISWRPLTATVPHFNWKYHLNWSNCSFWYLTFMIGQLLWTWSSLRDDGLVARVQCSHVEKLAEWSINSFFFYFNVSKQLKRCELFSNIAVLHNLEIFHLPFFQ